MNKDEESVSSKLIAATVRNACAQAAKEGFRDASISGLCQDGAMEAAVSAIQNLDLEKVLKEVKNPSE